VSHHYSQGIFTRQAHKGIPEGAFEEEQGLKGFFGPVSHLIKLKPSTNWVEIDGPLRPHMFDLVPSLKEEQKRRVLYNSDVSIEVEVVLTKRQGEIRARRNSDGDLLLFCHTGAGEILSEYGLLRYSAGNYIIIPKCLTYAIAATEKSAFLVVENKSSHYEEPERGLVGRHAIYDPAALVKPDLELLKDRLNHWGAVLEVTVKHADELTQFKYKDCVFSDVLGWKGDLYPFTLHVDHMMPLMSHRAHLPPSAHTTFVARDFVVCTFLPRPLESDKDALRVPFYHQNIDYDEVLFYHAGDFFSRDNLHAGMMSFHPAGFPHGPHPKAVKGIGAKTETNEYAVMIDVRKPLKVDPLAQTLELKDYWRSWQG
jgi:homogentisate 1,2-dioxygenase